MPFMTPAEKIERKAKLAEYQRRRYHAIRSELSPMRPQWDDNRCPGCLRTVPSDGWRLFLAKDGPPRIRALLCRSCVAVINQAQASPAALRTKVRRIKTERGWKAEHVQELIRTLENLADIAMLTATDSWGNAAPGVAPLPPLVTDPYYPD